MNDWIALHQRVLEHPADDTVRLICADWLDEHENPGRAAMIRAHIRAHSVDPVRAVVTSLAPQSFADCDATFVDDMNVVLEHLRQPTSWPDQPMAFRQVRNGLARFERGFLGGVTISGGDWIFHAGELTRLHPITTVCLQSLPPADALQTYYETLNQELLGDVEIEVSAEEVQRLFAMWWPRITFELPASGH